MEVFDSGKIKELREDRGWTQSDLAVEMLVSLDSIKGWEKGRSNPGIRNRKKLRDLFNRYLING